MRQLCEKPGGGVSPGLQLPIAHQCICLPGRNFSRQSLGCTAKPRVMSETPAAARSTGRNLLNAEMKRSMNGPQWLSAASSVSRLAGSRSISLSLENNGDSAVYAQTAATSSRVISCPSLSCPSASKNPGSPAAFISESSTRVAVSPSSGTSMASASWNDRRCTVINRWQLECCWTLQLSSSLPRTILSHDARSSGARKKSATCSGMPSSFRDCRLSSSSISANVAGRPGTPPSSIRKSAPSMLGSLGLMCSDVATCSGVASDATSPVAGSALELPMGPSGAIPEPSGSLKPSVRREPPAAAVAHSSRASSLSSAESGRERSTWRMS
mmetsp:Transcript_47344/g.111466  ORF Transcript_47344/g.111466 Transcript_47344/m.111466 type:complete len:327 (+) Transcript_47344:262-1242(+)